MVDNGGVAGAQTPLWSPVPFELTVANAGSVRPQAALNLASLRVAATGRIAHPSGQPGFAMEVQGDATVEADGAILASCDLAVHGNLLVTDGGVISANGMGFGTDAGPGKGNWNYYHPSGAGHGGHGGYGRNGYDQPTPGGPVYGSEAMPVELGSGGGRSGESGAPGGAGGGAVQLTVAGTLTVNGSLTASGVNGAAGGSGGSILLSVGQFAGSGVIHANGGTVSGYRGGGGGGGRIAIYSASHGFLGTTAVSGGTSGSPNTTGPGQTGTIHLAAPLAPKVIAQSPGGPINRFLSYVDLTFDQAIDPATFTTDDILLTTPAGPLPASQITLTGDGGVTWRIGFPAQFADGDYSLSVGQHLANLFGQEMATGYGGGFSVHFTPPTLTASRHAGNLLLSWASVVGLSYQVQSTPDLATGNWVNEGLPMNGTGGTLSASVPIGSAPRKFFRLLLLEN